MKTKLLNLFVLVFALSIFTACSSNDDEEPGPTDESWKELSKKYENDFLILNLTFKADKSVEVNAISAEEATVILNNIVPEDKALSVQTKLVKTNNLYSLSGETTVNDCLVSINGDFSDDGKLTLNITRKITSAIAGTWKLNYINLGGLAKLAGVYWRASTGVPEQDEFLVRVGPLLSGMIAGKISALNVILGEDGVFDVNWTKQGESNPTGLPAEMESFNIKIYYAVIDGQLMIAIDKNIIKLLPLLAEKTGISMEQIEAFLPRLNDLGGYYAIALECNHQGDNAVFYISDKKVVTLIGMLLEGAKENMKEEILQQVTLVMGLLGQAKELEFGLNFNR